MLLGGFGDMCPCRYAVGWIDVMGMLRCLENLVVVRRRILLCEDSEGCRHIDICPFRNNFQCGEAMVKVEQDGIPFILLLLADNYVCMVHYSMSRICPACCLPI